MGQTTGTSNPSHSPVPRKTVGTIYRQESSTRKASAVLDHRFSFTRHFTDTYTKLNNCPNFAGSMTSILNPVAFTAALLKHDCSVTRNSNNS